MGFAGRRRPPVALLVGVAAVVALLAWPTPGGVARTGGGATGPTTLAAAWPSARPVTLPGQLADGSRYSPAVMLDATSSVGTATSPDRSRLALVVLAAAGPARTLASLPGGEIPGSFPAVTADRDRLYWAQTLQDSAGMARTSLWSAPRGGGAAVRLVADAGPATFFHSQYDLRPADGRLYWLAAGAGGTELRSVPVGGGSPETRAVGGQFAPVAWPWLSSAGSGQGGPAQLYDARTGHRTTVHGNPLGCGARWCRAQAGGRLTIARPDGSDPHPVDVDGVQAPLNDVALLDRFEVIGVPQATGAAADLQRLGLYDLKRRRVVWLEPSAADLGAAGGWLWWSTGSNEALTFHALRLDTLS